MLTEQNKALVLQFYKAFDDRKMDQALDLLTVSLRLVGFSRNCIDTVNMFAYTTRHGYIFRDQWHYFCLERRESIKQP
jgi:hypothetical protein